MTPLSHPAIFPAQRTVWPLWSGFDFDSYTAYSAHLLGRLKRSYFRSRLLQQAECYTFVPLTSRIGSYLKAAAVHGRGLQPSLVRRSPYTERWALGSRVLRVGLQSDALSFVSSCRLPGMPWFDAAAGSGSQLCLPVGSTHASALKVAARRQRCTRIRASLSGDRSRFSLAPTITTANTCYFRPLPVSY